jgi:hypothetical protein
MPQGERCRFWKGERKRMGGKNEAQLQAAKGLEIHIQ